MIKQTRIQKLKKEIDTIAKIVSTETGEAFDKEAGDRLIKIKSDVYRALSVPKPDELGYMSIDSVKCDVINAEGKPCNEQVEPEIGWDACSTFSSLSTPSPWKYQPRFHCSWSCKHHGSVPISINGIPSDFSPEEFIGEFKQVADARKEGEIKENARISEIIKKFDFTDYENTDYDNNEEPCGVTIDYTQLMKDLIKAIKVKK